VAGAQGGFDATLRLLRHGTTTIDDFRHYPGRSLAPSPAPFRFSERAEGRVQLAGEDVQRLLRHLVTDGARAALDGLRDDVRCHAALSRIRLVEHVDEHVRVEEVSAHSSRPA